MRVLIYFPFVACAIGAAGAGPVARRAAPHLSARVLAATGLVLALTNAAALSLLAFTVVARIPIVAAHGHWASSAVGRKVDVPTWVGGYSPMARGIAAREADGWNGWGLSADQFASLAAGVRAESEARVESRARAPRHYATSLQQTRLRGSRPSLGGPGWGPSPDADGLA